MTVTGMVIKHRRLYLGLKQRQVARRLGITRSGYANLENGHRDIKPWVKKITQVLHKGR